jgi:predicted chitinase
MTGPSAPTVADVILALLLCGILGVLGQGVRAIVGLKNAGSLNSTTPGEQAVFSLAYLALSLMIGFIAGVLAGIALNLETIITVDPSNWKLLVGIAGSGYVGADFIENAMSVVIPGTKPTQAKAPPLSVGPATAAPLPPRIWRKARPPTPQTDGAKALTAAMRTVCPEVNAAVWAPVLASAFDNFDFSNDRRKAAAVGQFLVEAGPALNATVEDLYYSPDRACEVWPALFSSPQAAASYCDDPRRFADYVYAGVNGNGDAASGDGYRFRGRGLIQLTGRDEYEAFGRAIGKTAEEAAAFCETHEGAAWSGCWYLARNGCLPLADAWDIDAITRRVNGPAMEAAGERLRYSDAMLNELRGAPAG